MQPLRRESITEVVRSAELSLGMGMAPSMSAPSPCEYCAMHISIVLYMSWERHSMFHSCHNLALQRTGHTLMIWSRLSKWLLPSVNIIQPGCWSCHQHSKAASAISATCSKHTHSAHQRTLSL